MSDGPTPKNWEIAAPALLWGVFAFAFGFEGVAMLFEGKWILAIAGIVAAIILTGVAMRWKQIAKLSPNLSKTAISIATDARLWISLTAVLLITLTWEGFASDRLADFFARYALNGSPNTGKIIWNFEQTAHGGGYFLTMQKLGDEEIRVIGFGAHGKNNSSDPISQFSGYMRSERTNAQIPIYVLAQDPDESKVLACFPHPWIPTLPQETFGIPAFADFDIGTFEKPFIEAGKDGVTVTRFLNDFVPFTISLEYDGIKIERRFSREEVNKQVEIFEKSLNPLSDPHVLRRANASPPAMLPLRLLLAPATPVPPASLPPLKLLVPPANSDPTPTGTIPSKE
jgi:hypothetical protein